MINLKCAVSFSRMNRKLNAKQRGKRHVQHRGPVLHTALGGMIEDNIEYHDVAECVLCCQHAVAFDIVDEIEY